MDKIKRVSGEHKKIFINPEVIYSRVDALFMVFKALSAVPGLPYVDAMMKVASKEASKDLHEALENYVALSVRSVYKNIMDDKKEEDLFSPSNLRTSIISRVGISRVGLKDKDDFLLRTSVADFLKRHPVSYAANGDENSGSNNESSETVCEKIPFVPQQHINAMFAKKSYCDIRKEIDNPNCPDEDALKKLKEDILVNENQLLETFSNVVANKNKKPKNKKSNKAKTNDSGKKRSSRNTRSR